MVFFLWHLVHLHLLEIWSLNLFPPSTLCCVCALGPLIHAPLEIWGDQLMTTVSGSVMMTSLTRKEFRRVFPNFFKLPSLGFFKYFFPSISPRVMFFRDYLKIFIAFWSWRLRTSRLALMSAARLAHVLCVCVSFCFIRSHKMLLQLSAISVYLYVANNIAFVAFYFSLNVITCDHFPSV